MLTYGNQTPPLTFFCRERRRYKDLYIYLPYVNGHLNLFNFDVLFTKVDIPFRINCRNKETMHEFSSEFSSYYYWQENATKMLMRGYEDRPSTWHVG